MDSRLVLPTLVKLKLAGGEANKYTKWQQEHGPKQFELHPRHGQSFFTHTAQGQNLSQVASTPVPFMNCQSHM